MKTFIESNNEKILKQDILFGKNEKVYVKLNYEDIKKMSFDLIERNRKAYNVLANS